MSGSRQNSPNGWVPWAGLLIAVAGIVFQGGQLSSNVQRNTDRITKLEASDQARSDAITSISVRTARIEAKLDIMMLPKDARQ